ncbi:MAG: AAA domain-containing protein, partial [Nostocoides sp.]
HPGGLAKLMSGAPTRLSDLVREPAALDEARRRVRAIAARTRELKEERGIATGFIAIGMATWTLPRVSRPPAAPVLLRSCVLKATGAAQDDFVVDLGQDIEFNPVLRHYLGLEQGLTVDEEALEDLASASGTFDAHPVFAALGDLCAGLADFEVQSRLVIGNFSYAKLPMVADLAAQGDLLADHDVIAALAGDPEALRSVRGQLPPESPHDIDPDREHLILDADATQVAAIEAVRSGAHLVIKGPPGTGKSQTIANLVATLTGEGKRVLFVAEKRAAIDAVLDRLEGAGLADLVLDLHDGTASRRRIAADILASLERLSQDRAPDDSAAKRELTARRTTLTDHVTALHRTREPWGVTAYEAQEAISRLGGQDDPPRSRVRLRGEALQGLSRDDITQLARDLTAVGALGAWDSTSGDDPWYAACVTSPDEALQARDLTARLASGGIDAMGHTMGEVFASIRLPTAETVADWGRTLAAVSRVRDSLEVFRPEVFDIPLDDLVAATGTSAQRQTLGSSLGWFERRRFRKQARSLLRPGAPPADLHAALVDAGTQRSVWRTMAGGGGRPEIPADLDVAEAAYAALERDLAWLGERLAPTAAGGDLLHTPLPELRDRLAALAARPERLAIIPTVMGALDEVRAAGLQPLVDDLADRSVDPGQVTDELDFVWWTSVVEDLALRDPAYGAHSGDALRTAEAAYALADRQHLADTAVRVRAAAGDRLRRTLDDHPQQESLVRGEAAKSRRHRALRDLLDVAGPVLTAVKPCWAMSPLVVASALPPGQHFDVVIFDEASQIPPAQAISAISRARQVVVAGDEHQLPPTSFFTTTPGDDDAPIDEGLTEGFESILDVLSAALPARQLSWHYRSRDERLIAFANHEVYGGTLVTFPGASSAPVLDLVTVEGEGVMAEGDEGVETTTAEVDKVVELVLAHARTRPTESLGVIALGIKHAQRLEDAVRRAIGRSDAADVADYFDEDAPARFFVKNLERVQGDERDAIILSVGYGKTPHGRVLHRFGPLNLEGGERRLNVAVTRARQRMTVVSAITAEDLDPSRLRSRGAMMLRDYLAYAASGGAAPTAPRPAPASGSSQPARAGVVMAEFARRLREAGLVVHEGYGSSGHAIDLAVEDPAHRGRLLLAVEGDGPAYAALTTTRDRDRLRPEQLARLGWRPTRVWSTDLFRDPARDVARIVTAAQSAGVPSAPTTASAETPVDGAAPSPTPEGVRDGG